MRTSLAVVLAHQGGWDEILYAAVPVVLLALMLVLANRRARKLERDRDKPSER